MFTTDLNKNLTAGDWHSLTNGTTKALVATAFSNTKIIAEVYGSEADLKLLAAAPLLAYELQRLVNAALAAGLNDTHPYFVQAALRALEKAGTPRPRPVAPPLPPISDAAFRTVEQVVGSVRARSSGRAHVRTELEAGAALAGIRLAWPSVYGTDVRIGPDRNGWYVDWKVGSCE